ncbi:MAG: glycosyltransferase [Clostridiales bacterium]|nr:glycosyltransferase [Clostridiales bacterium]
MKGSLITVLMSVYNEENNIDESIQSILAQTYENFEFIIIDDASTDHTVEKILNYKDKRIVFIRNEVNCGLTKNLNYGLKIAKGKYVLRMDGDDISLPERFEKQVEFMERNPRIALSGSGMKRFGECNKSLRPTVDKELLKINLIFNSVIAHPTVIVRKDFIDMHEIQYDENLQYAQDYMFVYQVSQKGDIANMPIILLKYRTHKEQISLGKADVQLRCANVTRKRILKDLGIGLNDTAFQLWCDFCTGNKRKLSFRDIVTLQRIIKLFIQKNQRMRSYNGQKLKEQLKSRTKDYYRDNARIAKWLYIAK